ncbi:MAG: methionine adenosyltransferase [Magnetospirillum sp. WYHS-4]
MRKDFLFTSESVTEGHPDKLCDQISDSIVDEFLREDPFSRVVAECAVSTGLVFIAARFASRAQIDIPSVARRVIGHVGYDEGEFDAKSCSIMTTLNEMPDEAYKALDERAFSEEEIDRFPAQNLVTVFGYACRQTPGMIPLPIWLSHKLARRLATVRLTGKLPYLEPDGTTQVGVEYKHRQPDRIHSMTLVAALDPQDFPDPATLERDLWRHVIEPVFADEEVKPDADTHIFVNPGGTFLGGGPARHSGLTGRKTASDLYGGFCRQGGAALSGKDPVRVDRVGAYAARYAAKNIVAAGLADECEIQLSYALGQSRPFSVHVETFGTKKVPHKKIEERVNDAFDFRPAAIIRQFGLRHLPQASKRGFYGRLAAYGHVGRLDLGLPWELVDKAAAIKE